MALFPYYRSRFLDDPFFFHHLDFFGPWCDCEPFPSFSPARRFRSIEEMHRLTYSSTNALNCPRTLELPPPPTPPPAEPEKFHVELNVDGFDPQAIKQRVEGQQLIVEGKQEDRQEKCDHTVRELRATYSLPSNADTNRLTTHMTPNKTMIIEAPIQNPASTRRFERIRDDRSMTQYSNSSSGCGRFLSRSNCHRRNTDNQNNQNKMEMLVDMKNYRPEDINVSVTNNELIIKGEYEHNDGNRSEKSTFFRSTTLPPGVQVNRLESHFNDNGQLKIQAPYA